MARLPKPVLTAIAEFMDIVKSYLKMIRIEQREDENKETKEYRHQSFTGRH